MTPELRRPGYISAPSAQFEKTLQPPSHAEANGGAEDRTDRLSGGAGGDTSAAQRVADKGQSECPDPDPEFHGLTTAKSAIVAAGVIAIVHPTATGRGFRSGARKSEERCLRSDEQSKPQRLIAANPLQPCLAHERGLFRACQSRGSEGRARSSPAQQMPRFRERAGFSRAIAPRSHGLSLRLALRLGLWRGRPPAPPSIKTFHGRPSFLQTLLGSIDRARLPVRVRPPPLCLPAPSPSDRAATPESLSTCPLGH